MAGAPDPQDPRQPARPDWLDWLRRSTFRVIKRICAFLTGVKSRFSACALTGQGGLYPPVYVTLLGRVHRQTTGVAVHSAHRRASRDRWKRACGPGKFRASLAGAAVCDGAAPIALTCGDKLFPSQQR